MTKNKYFFPLIMVTSLFFMWGFVHNLAQSFNGLAATMAPIIGARIILTKGSSDEETATRFMQLMRTYNARAVADGSGFYANPSPGNIRDGLITDAMKSAGAAKKGGSSPVTAVLNYPEKVQHKNIFENARYYRY